MNLEETFGASFFLNLTRRQDRRFAVMDELDAAGISAERFPAVDGKRLGWAGGFGNAGYHALAITNRVVLRQASLRGASAVLMFEDDVVLHPRFQELVAQIELPEDWEMFFFGCKHVCPPDPAGPGLVRAAKAFDWHAVAFRERAYLKVRRALARLPGSRPGLPSNDQRVAELQKEMPTYAAWPNLAWQRVNKSDLTKGIYSAYHPDGRQAVCIEAVKGLDERMAACYGPGGGLKLAASGGRGRLIVRLTGGLGSQMFQYAFGQSLAWDLGMVVEICGKSLTKEPVPQPYHLGSYGLAETAPPGAQGRHLDHWEDSPAALREKFYTAVRSAPAGLWELNGLFRNERLFAKHAEEIRRVFHLKPIHLPVPAGATRVCVQVLRVKRPPGSVCTLDFYLCAIRIMAVMVPQAHFIVVSDDLEWCCGSFPPDYTFYGIKEEEETQRVMRGCDAYILSDDPAGWWAAWVTSAQHVIRPQFSGPEVESERLDYPKRWIALPIPADGGAVTVGASSSTEPPNN